MKTRLQLSVFPRKKVLYLLEQVRCFENKFTLWCKQLSVWWRLSRFFLRTARKQQITVVCFRSIFGCCLFRVFRASKFRTRNWLENERNDGFTFIANRSHPQLRWAYLRSDRFSLIATEGVVKSICSPMNTVLFVWAAYAIFRLK